MQTAPGAIERWGRIFQEDVRRILRPKPRLLPSQWAPLTRRFAQGTSEAGAYNPQRTPYLIEIMDALAEPSVERIVVMKPARSGYTEGVIANGIGYSIDQRPTQILAVFPTVDLAQKFVKQKLEPMIDESPALAAILPPRRSRNAQNTILYKKVPGGSITVTGANSPTQLRQLDAEFIFIDEVDANPRSSGKEGDVIELAATRGANYDGRKLVVGSSPTWKGVSRIEELYDATDRRQYWMPCPHCGEMQVLHLGGKDEAFGLKWVAKRPDTVFYLCLRGCEIQERKKREMHVGARWIPRRPENPDRGYWWNQLVSLLPAGSWPRLVDQWLKAQVSPEALQVFVNTNLAETFELKGEVVASSTFIARREVYPAEVPAGVGLLTSFTDVQKDRLETLIVGWGSGQEAWRIRHEVIWGDPDGLDVWEQHDGLIFRSFRHESGADLRIRLSLVDSGDKAQKVYNYVRPRQKRQVFASKGDKGDPKAPIAVRAKRPMDAGVKLITIGTFNAKRTLFANLSLTQPGPRYWHFHRLPDDADVADRALFNAQDERFMRQYESEKLIREKDHLGRPVVHYVQVAPDNEAVDLSAGNIAALHVLGPLVYERLDRLVNRIRPPSTPAEAKVAAAAPSTEPAPDDDTSPPTRRRSRENSWVYGFRR